MDKVLNLGSRKKIYLTMRAGLQTLISLPVRFTDNAAILISRRSFGPSRNSLQHSWVKDRVVGGYHAASYFRSSSVIRHFFHYLLNAHITLQLLLATNRTSHYVLLTIPWKKLKLHSGHRHNIPGDLNPVLPQHQLTR